MHDDEGTRGALGFDEWIVKNANTEAREMQIEHEQTGKEKVN